MAEETQDNQPQDQTADTPEATEGQAPEAPPFPVDVEDAGTLRKKITVTVPESRIDAKRDELFGELSNSAQVPGFRPGRAPRRLIEKRFGKEIGSDVRNALVGEALGQAIEQTELNTLGEPDLDLDAIELPESGDMQFSFEVEIAPEFELPELSGIEVEKPAGEATDERVQEEIDGWRQSRAKYEPADEPADEGDVVTAGATIQVEGIDEPVLRPGQTLRVAPGQVDGLPLVDLGDALKGKKAGDSSELKVTVPDAHPNEDWQGKEATVRIEISEVRKQRLPEMTDELAAEAGFEDTKELEEFVRDRLSQRLENESRQAMHKQVQDYLLENTDFELPEGVVRRHTARTLQRRYVELMQMGIPREHIDERITELQAAATEQAQRDLKLQFILDKVAEQQGIQVGDAEVNARIAQMASMYDRRPERVRQELAADGTLDQLQVVIREEKAMDKLLEDAKVTEVQRDEGEQESAKTSKKTSKTSKTSKKASKSSKKGSGGGKSSKKSAKSAKKDGKSAEKKAKKSEKEGE